LGVWSSILANRIRAASKSAARRTARALPSKSMSLLVSGASAPTSPERSPRKRIQNATAWPPHEHDRTVVAQWLQQAEDARHLLISEGRLGSHMRLPKRTRGGEVHTSRARKWRQQLVLLAQLFGGLTTRAQIALVLLARDLLLRIARTNVEMLVSVLHRAPIVAEDLSHQVIFGVTGFGSRRLAIIVEGLSSTRQIAHP
jgi:hypothetical protein